MNSVLQHGANNMQLFPRGGEEAVGYSLYHRQSASVGDALQNLSLLTASLGGFELRSAVFV